MKDSNVNIKVVVGMLTIALLLGFVLLFNAYSDTAQPAGGNKSTANSVDSQFDRKTAACSAKGNFEDIKIPQNTAEPDKAEIPEPPIEVDQPMKIDKPVVPDIKPVVIKYDAKPLADWNADKAEYRRISQDESLPQKNRSDASAKISFRFAEWRGRKRGRLGGFEFELADYSLLQDWEIIEPQKAIRVLRYKEPVFIEKTIGLKNGEAGLSIKIRVAISVEWAHQTLLNSKMGATSGLVYKDWGDLHGVEIGDVWFSGPVQHIQNSITDEGRLTFARRNVIVDVNFGNRNGSKHKLDVVRLARQLDAQVIEQSLPGNKWSDIADSCPKIAQFEAGSTKLAAESGIRTPIVYRVELVQNDDSITLRTTFDGGVSVYIKSKNPSAKVAALAENYLDTNSNTAKVWLIAINERNLLFSVAEIEFTLVKPD